jgi:hypothetical protein
MYVTAWSNGRPVDTGAGYGIRLSLSDRDRFFDPGWSGVSVSVADGEPILVPLSNSFWCMPMTATSRRRPSSGVLPGLRGERFRNRFGLECG